MEQEKRKQNYWDIIFGILLMIYPLRHVHLGVDLWDAGYNYANFTYGGLEYMDSMWYFATWLANGVGSFFAKLPLGGTCLGMNVYTGLVVSFMATTAFVFCVKKLKMPSWLVFIGEILAISLCWLPTAVLYTYLTYALLLVSLILLYQGVLKEEKRYLVAAGVILGLNVAVRFSNLVQTALILIVWTYGIIAKKKIGKVLQETGWCMLGYLCAVGAFLGVMSFKYGLSNYIEGILRLFQMTENAQDYTVGKMVLTMLKIYYDNTYFLKRYAVILAGTLIMCVILPKKWTVVKKAITVIATVALALWLVHINFYTGDYATYGSILYPCVTVLTLTLGLSVYQLVDRNATKENKLLGIMQILIILITSLGSNNAIFSNINNMFLVIPGFMWFTWQLCREKKHICYYPFKSVLVLTFVFLAVQSTQFGMRFVYEEATGGRDFSATIEEVPVLKGMRTNPERVAAITELYQYVEQQNLSGTPCILYGEIPAVAYFAQMPPALNIWSDLLSYDYEVMKQELQKTDERPVIILSAECGQYLIDGDASKVFWNEIAENKLKLLSSYMDENGYTPTFSNPEFVVYE